MRRLVGGRAREELGRDGQHLADGHLLDERRDEGVVDEENAVDLTFDIGLGERVGDRLRVRVRRTVGEPGPRLPEVEPPESHRRLRLLARREEADLLAGGLRLAHLGERPPQHLGVEGAGEPAVAGDRDDGDGLDVLAPLEQR